MVKTCLKLEIGNGIQHYQLNDCTISNSVKDIKQFKILALDIGGSTIKATVLDQQGKMLLDYKKAETPEHATPESVLETIQSLVKDFQNYDISVGFPGYVKKGIVFTTHS